MQAPLAKAGYYAVVASTAKPWQILSGFAVSGLLLALPGALLPLWDFHIKPDFGTAGNLFLAIGVGTVAGSGLGRKLDVMSSPGQALSTGCFCAAISLLFIALVGPSAPAFIGFAARAGVQPWLQAIALLAAGVSAGLVNTALLEAITPWYERDPAGMTLLAGSFFGGGSVFAALLLSQALDAAAPSRWLAVAALVPAAAGFAFSRLTLRNTEIGTDQRRRSRLRATEELRSPLAIFFALLLFFQFGSEWTLAGWLPVYLIDRLGLSPSAGVLLLAFYWFAVTGGRLIASRLLSRVHHGRLLALSAFSALFGCVVLSAATNLFGVISALILTGAGFSAIYPLCAERIGQRFSYYHPAYYSGIFSFALLGGTIAPWTLGHLAAGSSLQIVPLAVMLSSCAVFALILLIWLGSKVSGG